MGSYCFQFCLCNPLARYEDASDLPKTFHRKNYLVRGHPSMIAYRIEDKTSKVESSRARLEV